MVNGVLSGGQKRAKPEERAAKSDGQAPGPGSTKGSREREAQQQNCV